MDKYLIALKLALNEETRGDNDAAKRPGKYLKGMDRGMGNSKTVNAVAKGDKRLKYHTDVEAAKPEFISRLADKTKAAIGTRFYLSQRQATEFATYYGMDLERIASDKSSHSNSRDDLVAKYDSDKNLFYVVRNA